MSQQLNRRELWKLGCFEEEVQRENPLQEGGEPSNLIQPSSPFQQGENLLDSVPSIQYNWVNRQIPQREEEELQDTRPSQDFRQLSQSIRSLLFTPSSLTSSSRLLQPFFDESERLFFLFRSESCKRVELKPSFYGTSSNTSKRLRQQVEKSTEGKINGRKFEPVEEEKKLMKASMMMTEGEGRMKISLNNNTMAVSKGRRLLKDDDSSRERDGGPWDRLEKVNLMKRTTGNDQILQPLERQTLDIDTKIKGPESQTSETFESSVDVDDWDWVSSFILSSESSIVNSDTFEEDELIDDDDNDDDEETRKERSMSLLESDQFKLSICIGQHNRNHHHHVTIENREDPTCISVAHVMTSYPFGTTALDVTASRENIDTNDSNVTLPSSTPTVVMGGIGLLDRIVQRQPYPW